MALKGMSWFLSFSVNVSLFLARAGCNSVEIDGTSCHEPGPGISLSTVQHMVEEALDMVKNAKRYIGTEDSFLDWRVHDLFQAMIGDNAHSTKATTLNGWYEAVLSLKTGNGNKNLLVVCGEDLFQQVNGPRTDWIDTYTNIRLAKTSASDWEPPCQRNETLTSAYIWGKYLVICPKLWERSALQSGPTIGDMRHDDFEWKTIHDVWSGSAVIVHELLHAATSPILPGGYFKSSSCAVTDQKNSRGEACYGWPKCYELAAHDRMYEQDKAVHNADNIALLTLALYLLNTDFRTGIGHNSNSTAASQDPVKYHGSSYNDAGHLWC